MRTMFDIGSSRCLVPVRPVLASLFLLRWSLCLEVASGSSEACSTAASGDDVCCHASEAEGESVRISAASLLQRATHSSTANLTSTANLSSTTNMTSAAARLVMMTKPLRRIKRSDALVEPHAAYAHHAHHKRVSAIQKERGVDSSSSHPAHSKRSWSSSLLQKVKDSIRDAVTSKNGLESKDSEFFYGTIFVLTMFGMIFAVDTWYRPTDADLRQ
mmetsp:Transcript_28909/g.52854  ORF Transcript_28909/g.52854 Transcript_28909/m.52854 type:complete len:216 (-) Transcript_28909:120-767(-)